MSRRALSCPPLRNRAFLERRIKKNMPRETTYPTSRRHHGRRASAYPLLCPASSHERDPLTALIPRAAVTKGGRPRPEPRERRKLGDRPFRLLGFPRRQRLSGVRLSVNGLLTNLAALVGTAGTTIYENHAI
jgi:hypothetical protein